jgi:poly(A)-specific ribonuclease
VPYLSRREEVDAYRRARERDERSRNIADIELPENDTESLAFVQGVREQIIAWTSRTPVSASEASSLTKSTGTNDRLWQLYPDYLNIAPPNFDARPDSTRGLSGFQKRLVHQLVRAEFPGFVTVSKPTFIQILAYNEARETSHRSGRMNALKAQVSKQTGLRWLVEAMVGGDLSGIDPMDCAQNMSGEPVFVDKGAITRQLNRLRDTLREHQTVLAGHNLFTDLVYFYNTFIGILPEQVEDFGEAIRGLFPM